MNLRFPILVGPTAGGKSALAVALAQELEARGIRAEIITADAYQIYTGMDIGTAKPSPAERAGVPHHLLDLVSPHDAGPAFTVHDWLARATPLIDDLRARDTLPIVVGGTHLYAKSLVDGMFEGPEPDAALRAELASKPLEELRAELERVDPQAASRIHFNDQRRTVRALEVFRLTGTPISSLQSQWDRGARPDAALVGLEWDKDAINGRINQRVKLMMQAGLLDELRGLLARGPLSVQAREALGYKQLIEHLEGRSTLEEAVEEIKVQTRRFAKNQRTWLKRLRLTPGSVWLPGDQPPAELARAVADRLTTATPL
jgi:tRNA dimethylallyltransferase